MYDEPQQRLKDWMCIVDSGASVYLIGHSSLNSQERKVSCQ